MNEYEMHVGTPVVDVDKVYGKESIPQVPGDYIFMTGLQGVGKGYVLEAMKSKGINAKRIVSMGSRFIDSLEGNENDRDAVFASMTDTDVQTQSVIVGKAIRTDSADDNIGTKILDGHLTLLSKDKMSIEVYKNQIRALYPRCIVLVVSTPQQILANQMQRFETSARSMYHGASLETIAEQQQAELKAASELAAELNIDFLIIHNDPMNTTEESEKGQERLSEKLSEFGVDEIKP